MSSQLNSAAITLTKEMPMEKAYGRKCYRHHGPHAERLHA
jgi:hypothetical protein